MKGAPGRQFFRRKIIDRDSRGDGRGGGFELYRLVGGDGALLHRLIDVADARRMHTIADRLHRDRQGKGALKERNADFEDIFIDSGNKPAWFARICPLTKVPLLKIERSGQEG